MDNDESRVLSVNYGSFSLSLEGFDQPFPILKEVTEFFRTMTQVDPHFGAEALIADEATLADFNSSELSDMIDVSFEGDVMTVTPKNAEDESDSVETAENGILDDQKDDQDEIKELEALDSEEISPSNDDDLDEDIDVSVMESDEAPEEEALEEIAAEIDDSEEEFESDEVATLEEEVADVVAEATEESEAEVAEAAETEAAELEITEEEIGALIKRPAAAALETNAEVEEDQNISVTAEVDQDEASDALAASKIRRKFRIIRNDYAERYNEDEMEMPKVQAPLHQEDSNVVQELPSNPFKRFSVSDELLAEETSLKEDVRLAFRKLKADNG